MQSQNIFLSAGKSIAIDLVGDVLYFPIWWYTVGLKNVLVNYFKSIGDAAHHLALRLLLLNIFRPMFAQYDRAGRIISFFMRIIILIARSLYFFIYSVLRFIFVIIWIFLPILVFSRLVTMYLSPYV